MNSRKIKYIFRIIISVLIISSINSGCGIADGVSNAGIATTYDFIYFGNFGSSTITSYHIRADGSTILVADTISTGTGTSSVNGLTGRPDGKFLYSANKSTNNLSWYSVDSLAAVDEGKITFSGSTGAEGNGTSAIAIHPNGNICYIANSTDLTNNISLCTLNSTTGLMTVDNDTFYTARTNPTNLKISPDGRFLFVVNRGTADISTFSINATSGVLNTVNLSVAAGTEPEDLVIHPTGSFLYTLSTGTDRVIMHRISSGGVLTVIGTGFIATDADPKKIAVSPDGKYVYVTNNTSNTISAYSVNQSTGELADVPGSPFVAVVGAGVYALGVTSDNKFLVVSGDTSRKGYVYEINEATGAITFTGTELGLGSNPRSMAIVPLTATE